MKRRFDSATAAGLIFGLLAVFGGFLLEGGEMGALVLLPALVIVFGGTFATAMIGTSLRSFFNLGRLLRVALLPPVYDVPGTMQKIVDCSVIARREGLLSMEKEIEGIRVPFLKKLLRLVIDGTDADLLRSLGEMEIRSVADRHARGAAMFQKMGGYSPTMGIIGTVMGLIATLAAAGEDPTVLIRHIAGAFIATLWGVFMANLVWLPIADKLREIHTEEEDYLQMILEGVLAVHTGEVPSVVRAKLTTMYPTTEPEGVPA